MSKLTRTDRQENVNPRTKESKMNSTQKVNKNRKIKRIALTTDKRTSLQTSNRKVMTTRTALTTDKKIRQMNQEKSSNNKTGTKENKKTPMNYS